MIDLTEKNTVGDRIRQRREEKGLTQDALAEKLSMNKSTVTRYESGAIEKIKLPVLEKLAEALDVKLSWLTGESDSAEASVLHSKSVKIPVLGYVPAGVPVTAVEDVLDYEEISAGMAETGEFFALRIKGDSMEPRMTNGDVVIVRQQSSVENGEIAVVLVGDESTVKKFYRTPAGVKLVATNPVYDPFFFTPDEVDSRPVSVIGRVVELRAKF